VITRTVTITNPLGLHARAAARFVRAATAFESAVQLGSKSRIMDGKSILGILLLTAAQGTVLTVSADGPDEETAVATLTDLIASGLGDDTWSG
jgi:phosphocarrier protein HPr